MALQVTDIPTRDGLDGTQQLVKLRAYLKDSQIPYKYPDSILIPPLTTQTVVTTWQNLKGYNSDAVPWEFDELLIGDPVNKVRSLTEDTVELSLKYTNLEILRFLEVIPLRYVVNLLNLRQEIDASTFPSDINHPIHILRKYLSDEDGTAYTDHTLIDSLLGSGLDPFAYVVERLDHEIAANSAMDLESSTDGLVSIDGITFADTDKSSQTLSDSRENVLRQSIGSVYSGGPKSDNTFAFYEDGKDISNTLARDWYEV